MRRHLNEVEGVRIHGLERKTVGTAAGRTGTPKLCWWWRHIIGQSTRCIMWVSWWQVGLRTCGFELSSGLTHYTASWFHLWSNRGEFFCDTSKKTIARCANLWWWNLCVACNFGATTTPERSFNGKQCATHCPVSIQNELQLFVAAQKKEHQQETQLMRNLDSIYESLFVPSKEAHVIRPLCVMLGYVSTSTIDFLSTKAWSIISLNRKMMCRKKKPQQKKRWYL